MTDPEPHIHAWNRETRQPCTCGQPVPSYLLAAWNRYAAQTESGS